MKVVQDPTLLMRIFGLCDRGRSFLNHLKTYSAGAGLKDNTCFASVDLFEIVKNVNFKLHAGDNAEKKISSWMMGERSRTDLHLCGPGGAFKIRRRAETIRSHWSSLSAFDDAFRMLSNQDSFKLYFLILL